MKRLLYISILFIAVLACKSEDLKTAYSVQVEGITGKWKLIADEKGVVGQSVSWVAVKEDSVNNVIFRSDGVLLTNKGLPACCAPVSLTINGRFLEIKPVGSLAPNPECAFVNCANCPNWEIVLDGNEMIITSCNSSRKKYVRI